jgi:hypothetical protein
MPFVTWGYSDQKFYLNVQITNAFPKSMKLCFSQTYSSPDYLQKYLLDPLIFAMLPLNQLWECKFWKCDVFKPR